MGQGAGAASVEYLVHSPMIRSQSEIMMIMMVAVVMMIMMVRKSEMMKVLLATMRHKGGRYDDNVDKIWMIFNNKVK